MLVSVVKEQIVQAKWAKTNKGGRGVKYELRVRTCKFRYTGYEIWFASYKFLSTNYDLESASTSTKCTTCNSDVIRSIGKYRNLNLHKAVIAHININSVRHKLDLLMVT